MTRCQPVRSSVQDMAPISLSQTPAPASPTGRDQTATLVIPEDYCSPAEKTLKIASAHHQFASVLVARVVLPDTIFWGFDRHEKEICIGEMGLCACEYVCVCVCALHSLHAGGK